MALAGDKFRKVCGLLSSDHDGERATAARMATDILKAANLTWDDVLVDSPAGGGARDLQSHIQILKQLLDDERSRTTRLIEELNALKKGAPRPQRAPSQKPSPTSHDDDDESDDELRDSIGAALELDMPERTREFFESVLNFTRWSDKQRDAIRRSLSWVLREPA